MAWYSMDLAIGWLRKHLSSQRYEQLLLQVIKRLLKDSMASSHALGINLFVAEILLRRSDCGLLSSYDACLKLSAPLQLLSKDFDFALTRTINATVGQSDSSNEIKLDLV
eukprot:TRINITY_DN6619_c0_g1_i1.p2 TRINITY_DN6619_c0_g1~~TRINITY_DN6619_c0_g1_i1.p2  ORF type:complete len:110 (+),score=33.03 TRINITY_DN6619_c0_g1_i1:836-1165(+)